MNLEKLIDNFVNPESPDELQQQSFEQIKELFSNQRLTIQDIIKLLESALISGKEKERYRGTLLLSDLLLQVTSCTLNGAVIHLLVVFFNQRLSDYPSIIPSLKALFAITKYHSTSFDAKYLDFVDIMQTIFKVFDVQSYAQSIRQCVFELLVESLKQPQCREQCSSIAAEVFTGVMISFDGEKDPRCLTIALDLVLAVVSYFDFALTTDSFEKVSDALAAYFPISFQPPPDDPYGITADDLNAKLFDCFLCHASLVPHCLPFFASQLLSDSTTTKIFALDAVSRLCRTHGVSILTSSFESVSEPQQPAVHRVTEAVIECIFESGSPDVAARGCDFVYEIASLVGASPHAKYAGEWRLFCAPLLQKSAHVISTGADSMRGEVACLVACAISASSVLCADLVYKQCLPPLLTALQSATLDVSSVASMSSDMEPSSCGHPGHGSHDHSHDHSHSDSHQLTGKSQLQLLRLLHQLVASSGYNSVSVLGSSGGITSELFLGYRTVFVNTTRLIKSAQASVLPGVVADSFAALGSLNPLQPFAGEILSLLKRLLGSECVGSATERQAIRDLCYQVLGCLLVRLDLRVDATLSEHVQYCIALATQEALSGARPLTEGKSASSVRFLVTVSLIPQLTEVTSKFCFDEMLRVSESPQSSSLALIGALGRQLNLFGAGEASRDRFSACANQLISLVSKPANASSFVSAIEALCAMLVSEVEWESWSQRFSGTKEVVLTSPVSPPESNADFAAALCVSSGPTQAAIENLFAMAEGSESSENVTGALDRVCALLRRVVLALAHDSTRQRETAAHLLQTAQRCYKSSKVARRIELVTSLVHSMVTYLDKSDAFFTAKSQHHDDKTANMDVDSESAPATSSFTNVICAIVFFVDAWVSSVGTASSSQLTSEVISILFNKVSVSQTSLAGQQLLRIVCAVTDRLEGTGMADEDCQTTVDACADLLVRTCKSILLRPLVKTDAAWSESVTAALRGIGRSSAEFIQGLAGVQSWQGFAVTLLVTLITAPDQCLGSDSVASRALSRTLSARLGSLLVSDRSLNFALGRLNLNLMHQQRTWSCLFPPLFSAAQRQLARSGDAMTGNAETRTLLAAVCSLAAPLPGDVLADSLSELVVTVVQALMLSCDALFERRPIDAPSSAAEPGVLLVSAERVEGSATIVSASSQLSPQHARHPGEQIHVAASSAHDPHDLLLCQQSLGSLERLLAQSVDLFAIHTSALSSRLLRVCLDHPEARCRSLALKCLSHIAKLPYHQLHALKPAVIKALGFALNDPKRAIRALAARVRNEYYSLA